MKKVGPNRSDENRIKEFAAEGYGPAEISEHMQIKERAIALFLNSLEGYDFPVPPESISNDDRRRVVDENGGIASLGQQANPGAGVVVDPANAPDEVITIPLPGGEGADPGTAEGGGEGDESFVE